MADFTGQPEEPWSWIPDEWRQPAPVDPYAIPDMPPDMGAQPPPDPFAIAEYGGINLPQLPPAVPPPPPPPPQRIGANAPIEESAGPTPAAARAPGVADLVDVSMGPPPGSTTLQPGAMFGIPASTLDGMQPPLPPPAATDPWDAAVLASNAPAPPPDDPKAEPVGAHQFTREELVQMGPVQYAELQAEQAERERTWTGIRAEEARMAEMRRKIEDDKIVVNANAEAQKAQNELNAEARTLANEKVDPERWWASRDTGQKIAGVIAAVVGGLVAGRAGGPNQGVAMINAHIERDLEAQRLNIQNRKGDIGRRQNIVDRLYQKSGDLPRALELARRASTEQVVREMETQRQQYAPGGTADMRIAGQMRQVIAQDADTRRKWAAEDEKRRIAKAELELKQKQADETARNNRAQTATANWRIAVDQKQGDKRLAFDEKKLKADVETEAKKLDAAGKKEEAQIWRERGISGLQVPKLENGKPVLDKATGKYATENKPLMNKDNTRWVPTGTPEEVNKLRRHKLAADKLVDILDQVEALGPEYLSNTANSAKLQELDQLWADAILTVKDSKELGVIAGPDLDLMGDYLGTPDPTRYKDSAAGRASARRRIISGMDMEMKGHDYNGPDYNPPNVYERKPSPVEAKIKAQKSDDRMMSYDMDGNLSRPRPIERNPDTGEIIPVPFE